MREGKSQIDPNVAREMELARLVKDARARGDSYDKVQALITTGPLEQRICYPLFQNHPAVVILGPCPFPFQRFDRLARS
jgi:hypothetical protein